LNPNRNPHLTQVEIEEYLREYLGVTSVLWLGEGIAGDDTDGHVDDLARFVDSSTIVTVVEEDPADANHQVLQDNLLRLRGMRDQNGDIFRIVQLPMPAPVEFHGQRLPASYANFYLANGIVIVPTYRDPNDSEALAILRRVLPDRRVIGIDSTDLTWGLGSFHCISQQEPA
jgi:agmatine deiminase